jgi:acetyl esterase/lipase
MSLFINTPSFGETRDRELLKDSSTFIYKQTEQGPLHAHVFLPTNHQTDAAGTLLIFFHGGFWDMPASTQFATQCIHFAANNCVCIAAETRVSSRHQSTPVDAIEDAQSLIVSAKKNAQILGIDPKKIVLVGAAGGAFLALQAAMAPKVLKEDEVDARPAALVLLSALVDTTPSTDYAARFSSPSEAKELSPSKLIRKKLAPMLFLHGKKDPITPLAAVVSFRRWMKWKNNRIELVEFEGADHRFFNFTTSHIYHDLSIKAIERFLSELALYNIQKETFQNG